MNTSLLGILLHQLPYQFRGAGVLSTIFFFLDLILFPLFVGIMILRFTLFTSTAVKATFNNAEELCLWGTAPIAFLTLTALVGLTGSTASSWSDSTQHGISLTAYVLWWIGTAYMTGTAWVVYYTMAKRKLATEATLPSTVFLPAVGTTTDAVVGATLVLYSYGLSARLSVPVIIVGYMLVGFGGWLAMLVYAVFLYSFFTNGLPAPAKLPGLMMIVGPAGQTCAALQLLGAAARLHFGGYNKGTFLTMSSAESLASASEMLGLMFLGFDVFWAVFCVYALVECGFQKKLVPAMTVSTVFTVPEQANSILT